MTEENPYAAPQADLENPSHYSEEEPIVRDGKFLEIYEDADIPERCISCNQPAQFKTRILAVRNYGTWIAIRIGMLAILIYSVFSIRSWRPGVSEPVLMAGVIVVFIAFSRLLQATQVVPFGFYTCAKHRIIRYAAAGITWFGVLIMICEPWLEKFIPLTQEIDMIVPFLICAVISMLLASKTHVRVRFHPNRQQPYVAQGFGEDYLNSFPEANQSTATSKQTLAP